MFPQIGHSNSSSHLTLTQYASPSISASAPDAMRPVKKKEQDQKLMHQGQSFENHLIRVCKPYGFTQEQINNLLKASKTTGGYLPGRPASPGILKRPGIAVTPKEIYLIGDKYLHIQKRDPSNFKLCARESITNRACVAFYKQIQRSSPESSPEQKEKFSQKIENALLELRRIHETSSIPGFQRLLAAATHVDDFLIEFIGIVYQEQTDLFEYISEKSLTKQQFRSVITQLIEALCGLHKKGITHRDLKPENILLSFNKDGQPRITIIDLEYSYRKDQRLRFFGGTYYCSPLEYLEAWHRREKEGFDPEIHDSVSGPEMDVWCFSMIVFIAYFRTMPFWARINNREQVMEALKYYSDKLRLETLHSESILPDAYDPVVEVLLALALCKDPDLRPTMEQLRLQWKLLLQQDEAVEKSKNDSVQLAQVIDSEHPEDRESELVTPPWPLRLNQPSRLLMDEEDQQKLAGDLSVSESNEEELEQLGHPHEQDRLSQPIVRKLPLSIPMDKLLIKEPPKARRAIFGK